MQIPTNRPEIISCEICGQTTMPSVLDLGSHPMCDDLVQSNDNRICAEYPIEILFCPNCKTCHQRFPIPKQHLFPPTYHYRSRFTADVLLGMENLVHTCTKRFGPLAQKTVVDIGCNDGSLLSIFQRHDALTIGVEPTGACLEAKHKGHVTYNEYFSETLARTILEKHGEPDFITFTNVFAHIEDLQGVIRALRIMMANSTVLVIENHYLGAVLNTNQFDTFYHEHPRTYSYSSFVHVAKLLDTQLLDVEFPSRYGGNIRVYMSNNSYSSQASAELLTHPENNELQFLQMFSVLRNNVERWQVSQKQFLLGLYNQIGKLRAKAFPGRAAILIKLLALDEELIDRVYEKPGSLKIGYYVPGTRIPICSDDDLFLLPNLSVPLLNLAWHIPNEIQTYLTANGYTGEVIDILSNKEFSSFPTRTL